MSDTITITGDVPTLVIQVLPNEAGVMTPTITHCNALTPFNLKMTLIRALLQAVEEVTVAERQGEVAAQAKMAPIMQQERKRVISGGRN